MNVTAGAVRARRRSCSLAAARAVAARASRLFAIARHHASTATSTRNSVVDDPRQRGAAARRQLLHARPRGARGAPSSRCPGCARRSCSRVWPNRLRVRLEEHRPVALLGRRRAGSEKLVNSFGEVFEANVGDVEDDDLPTLTGPDGSAAHVLAMYRRLAPLLAPLGRARRRAARCRRAARWQRRARQRRRGRARPRQRRRGGRRARSASSRTLTPGDRRATSGPLEYADLRHTDGYAVRLKGVSTTLDAPTSRRRNRTTGKRHGEGTTRIWSSASTSAPPR